MMPSKFLSLIRNPLGVIGLFIWLVYAISGIVFAAGAPRLEHPIPLVLASFMVVFPFAILAVFYVLVTQHHKKLYAPGDFKDERLFLWSATEQDVAELEKSNAAEGDPSTGGQGGQRHHAATLDAVDYRGLEQKALDAAERKLGRSVRRQIVAQAGRQKFLFDGVVDDSKRLEFFEVRYFRKPTFKREFIEAQLYRAISLFRQDAAGESRREHRFWFIVVTEFEDEALDHFRTRLVNSVDTENFDVGWLFLNPSDLV